MLDLTSSAAWALATNLSLHDARAQLEQDHGGTCAGACVTSSCATIGTARRTPCTAHPLYIQENRQHL